jgi:hypothetical protein
MSVPFYYPLHEVPHDLYRYTEFALRRFMDASGMRIVCLNAVGGAIEVLLDVISKNIMRLPLGGHLAARMLQAVGWQFARSRPGAKLSQKTSIQFPLGYFMIAERPIRVGRPY